jgi:hypothetical protein
MGNPRKRKAIKDGRMQKMIEQEGVKEQQPQPPKVTTLKEDSLLVETPVINSDNEIDKKSIDPFIAKELKEIERIPSNKKKSVKRKATTKKVTTTKKTTKKKTGGK